MNALIDCQFNTRIREAGKKGRTKILNLIIVT